MPGPVIVAYDPLREDRAPVQLARVVAHAIDASVLAVAVHGALAVDASEYGEESPVTAVAVAERSLHRLRDDLGVETRAVADTFVSHAIQDVARSLHAPLIVVGSTGRGPVGRIVPGSSAEGLLRGTPCPVLVAPRGWEPRPLRTIAVGFDDTPESRAALAAAQMIAARSGARLRVICVAHGSRAPALSAAAQAVVAGVEPELVDDDPGEVLLRASGVADLLVCGSRGRGPVPGLLLGSVSRRVVDGAACPVLVLSRGADGVSPPARRAVAAKG